MSARLRSYSWPSLAVKLRAAAIVLLPVVASQPETRLHFAGPLTCDARLAALFTPPRPQLGRYEVCTTPEALEDVAASDWAIEALPPLDAFGAAGPYDRGLVARLYGGRRARVARGWMRDPGVVVAITLVSPYPNATLTALAEGTLVIRYYLPDKP